jgi:hypothetical protein
LLDLGEISVEESGFFGTHHAVHGWSLRAPNQAITVHLPQDRAARAGERLHLAVDPKKVVVLKAP